MRRLALLGACALALLVPAAAQGGTVEGTVRPLAWAPEVEVCVVEGRPSETCTVPAADGTYALLDVPLGGARIEFVPSYRSGLLIQYYDHKRALAEATNIVITSPSRPVTGIDADLIEGGTIMGTATDAADGEPLPEVEVCAISGGSPPVRFCAATDSGGEYELHSLPTGSYKIGFWGEGASAGYEPWYHEAVRVTAGNTTTGVDASLAKGGQIRGAVSAAAGGGRLPGITVCLFGTGEPKPQRCTYSGGAGEYSFVGLPSGSYQVGFSLEPAEITGGVAAGEDDGFLSQYYDGVDSRAAATAISLLAPATAEGIDAALVTPPAPVPAPPPIVATPMVPAAPPIAAPGHHRKGCRKGYKKRRGKKGKIRCVKVAKHKARHRHKARRHHNRQAGRRKQRS